MQIVREVGVRPLVLLGVQAGGLHVSRPHHVEEFLVLLGDVMGVRPDEHESDRGARLDLQRLPGPLQQQVGARVHEMAVETCAGQPQGVQVLDGRTAVHVLDVCAHQVEGDAAGQHGQARGRLLQGRPDHVGLTDRLLDEGDDETTAAQAILDQTQALQFAQGLPDRGLTGAEVRRDPGLYQPLAAFQLPGDDEFHQAVADALVERRLRHPRTGRPSRAGVLVGHRWSFPRRVAPVGGAPCAQSPTA